MAELTVVINNKFGIHARPAATLVKTAASYKSSVKLTSGEKTVDAKSILGVMSLGLKMVLLLCLRQKVKMLKIVC